MLIGRNYEIMQNELDGDFSKMHVKIKFRVSDVLGSDAITEFIGHQMMQDHVRRQVRRDRGKIDDTVDVVTEDGFYVRFKPLILTRERVKSSQKNEIRSVARNTILKFGASSTWVSMQKSVMDGELDALIKEEASKISPIRMVMIRRTQLIQSGVVTNDGPTLEEIIAEEESTKESTIEIEDGEGNTEHQDMIEEGINESEMESEDSDEGIDYESMTVAELKVILKEAGKPVSGKKADLISRIME